MAASGRVCNVSAIGIVVDLIKLKGSLPHANWPGALTAKILKNWVFVAVFQRYGSGWQERRILQDKTWDRSPLVENSFDQSHRLHVAVRKQSKWQIFTLPPLNSLGVKIAGTYLKHKWDTMINNDRRLSSTRESLIFLNKSSAHIQNSYITLYVSIS